MLRTYVVTLVLCTMLCACSPKSPRGFRLPEGDADYGRMAFAELGCGSCHQIIGGPDETSKDRTAVILGGPVARVQTYGELVTSIINPSHKISPGAAANSRLANGESPMAAAKLNDRMTVTQLVDLVAFLQPLYNVVPPSGDPYVYY